MSCGLWKDTLAVAEDYLSLRCLGPHAAPPPPSEAAAAMRRLGQEIEAQHQARFHSLAQKFLKHCGPDLCSSLRNVMDELAGDGLFNWGRVVSLFTFAGVLARQLQEQQDLQVEPVSCRALAATIADYLETHKKDWLLENNGWEGFCKYSHKAREASQDSSVKTALVAVAGVGLASLTYLLVR